VPDKNGDTPSKRSEALKRAHDEARTERAIANTAKRRRIKAQRKRREGGK